MGFASGPRGCAKWWWLSHIQSKMGCQGSKDRDETGFEEESEGSRRHAMLIKSKSQMHKGMTQQEIDDTFVDCCEEDDMTQMNHMEWDDEDEFEFIDVAMTKELAEELKASKGEGSEGFDPNDEDSIRKHYIERKDAEWTGPSDAPRCGSFQGVSRCHNEEMGGNTWCPGFGESFKLRIGPNYKKTGAKAHSEEAIYSVVAVDFIRSSKPIHNIGEKMQLPKLDFTVNSQYVKPMMVINIMLPLEYSIWGADENGPCIQMVCVLIMKQRYVNQFNALITQDGRLHRGNGYVEMDINVAKWCAMAKATLYQMFGSVPERTLSVAHVIESREDEHMPEQTLCCLQLDRIECATDKEEINKNHPDL